MSRKSIWDFIATTGFCVMFLSFWFERTLPIFMTGLGMFIWGVIIVIVEMDKEKRKEQP